MGSSKKDGSIWALKEFTIATGKHITMARRKKHISQRSIPILSMELIRSAFLLLIKYSLPVYKRNINHIRPPVALGENSNAALAIVAMTTGLDYHLCRLKYLRDVERHKPPLPHTPYFGWELDDFLFVKLKELLIKSNEQRLLKQLIEITVCRDTVIHPKVFTITEIIDEEYNYEKIEAELPLSMVLRAKTKNNTMKRKRLTKILRLPIVPTWISYVDAVKCILVLHRFLNLLESRYGNPYAWIGGMTAYEKEAKLLFTGWNWEKSYPSELEDWVEAFYKSLSIEDQGKVKKVLGDNLAPYIKKVKQIPMIPKGSNWTIAEILEDIRKPRMKPDFLSKPPPKP